MPKRARSRKTPGGVLKTTGDVPRRARRGDVVEATYETPYLAHATMEPMNTTADVRADGVTLWTPTQAQTAAQAVAAKIAGLPLEAVTVNTTFVGGGFGRREQSTTSPTRSRCRRPPASRSKLVWTREDDIRNDPYRPGTVTALRGVARPRRQDRGAQTNVVVLVDRRPRASRTASITRSATASPTSPTRSPTSTPMASARRRDSGRLWRAPYANSNMFATESFVDELAHAAGTDPVAFRLAMLEPTRGRAIVLERVGKTRQLGRAARRRDARTALRWASGTAAGSRWWPRSRCPTASSRSTGSSPRSMSASRSTSTASNSRCRAPCSTASPRRLTGKITFADGAPVQKNFTDYTVLRMTDAPQIAIDIVPSHETSSGAGEIGTPCVAPAVANAVFALTGKRVRALPLSDGLA